MQKHFINTHGHDDLATFNDIRESHIAEWNTWPYGPITDLLRNNCKYSVAVIADPYEQDPLFTRLRITGEALRDLNSFVRILHMHQNDVPWIVGAPTDEILDEQVRLRYNEMGVEFTPSVEAYWNKSFYKWPYCLDANIFIAGGRDIHVEHAVLTMAVRWPDWFRVDRKIPKLQTPDASVGNPLGQVPHATQPSKSRSPYDVDTATIFFGLIWVFSITGYFIFQLDSPSKHNT